MWRPHFSHMSETEFFLQISVREYDYSALLYLSLHRADVGETWGGREGGGGPEGPEDADGSTQPLETPPLETPPLETPAHEHTADFSGGRLVFYDPSVNCVIHPEPGLLVAFASGCANLHAVETVSGGTRFALTMWFTRTEPHVDAVDPSHRAFQQWAVAAAAAEASGVERPQQPEAMRPASAPPGRDASLASAALCSLPANDPLCQGLLIAHTRGGKELTPLHPSYKPPPPTHAHPIHTLHTHPTTPPPPPPQATDDTMPTPDISP